MSVPERYVTANELAEVMGVSRRTISRMAAEGMPSETWGMGRTRRFLTSEALAWARGRSYTLSQAGGRCNAAPGVSDI